MATKEEIEYCAGPFLTVFDTVLRAREAHLKQALAGVIREQLGVST